MKKIIKRFPDRKFYLFGDSGEKDPEVYGEIARRHALNILHIYIRKAPGDLSVLNRFQKAFREIPVGQ